jgi:SpoVK/Ycf46/Vps4 family AAA+-type ATPase
MPELTVPPGVEGIVAMHELPDSAWESRWTRIVVPEDIKERLLNFTLFSLRHRARMDAVRLPVHGLIVLAGPPGTGKTTLAGGLADQAARALGTGVLFVEVDAHAFPSQMLGESQRSVARLFERTLPDLARRGGPTIVLLDEVESLAVSRSGASLETNPVDVHRATDAVLAGVDQVARACPNLMFVATTNHRVGVDAAFMSRADLVEDIALPNAAAVELILLDTLHQILGDERFREAERRDGAAVGPLAKACVDARLDARRVRKLVLRALASRRELALSPELLRIEDVAAALRAELK